MQCFDDIATAHGLKISAEKTKLMNKNVNAIGTDVRVSRQRLKTVHRVLLAGSCHS